MKITAYYCKALKKTGKPIIVNMDGKEFTTDHFEMKNVNIRMKFNNSKGRVKASGSTTVLEIEKNDQE